MAAEVAVYLCPAVMNALRWCIVHSAFLLQERHNKASVKFMNSEFCGIWNHNMKGEESFSSVNIPLLAFFLFFSLCQELPQDTPETGLPFAQF